MRCGRLAAAAGGVPWVSDQLTADTQFALQRWAFWAFVVAAVTDFFDGWLARRLDAETVWGAILDPIGDKVLVAGVILGLLMLGADRMVALPVGLILSVIVAVLLVGGVQLLSLGVLGEYVGRILWETMGRPLYVVRETIGDE